MVNKNQVYDLMQRSNSRYNAMRDSGNSYDAANAEAYRIAAQEWQSVALTIGTLEFNPETHLNSIMARWGKYVSTGKPWDDIEAIKAQALAEVVAEDRRLMEASRRKRGLMDKPAPRTGKRDKLVEKVAEAVRDETLRDIDKKVIQGVLNEFRQAFDMPMVEYR